MFFNIVMIADVARLVPARDDPHLLHARGRQDAACSRVVILPHCLPGIIDVARVNLAAAWPMLVVAELLAARTASGTG